MRVAFLSPEYPTEFEGAGGLATYVRRMAHAIAAAGHAAEVFVPCVAQSETLAEGEVLVHRVGWLDLAPLSACSRVIPWLLQARALATALEQRHAAAAFDLVQSADLLATGLFVRRQPGRRHVVRCSSAADLYNTVDRRKSFAEPIRERLE